MKRWTVGDLEPPLSGTALDGQTPVSLESSISATAHVRRADGTLIIRTATLGDQTTAKGTWTMPWETDDLNVSGQYKAILKVLWADSRPQTFGPEVFPVGEEFF